MAGENFLEHRSIQVADVAAVRRATKEQKDMIGRLRNAALDDLITYAGDPQQREAVLTKVAEINKLEQIVANTEAGFTALNPTVDKGPLPEAAKREIFGLYQTNRYTQAELGDQFNVTQPSIAEILKKQKARFLAENKE